MAGPTSALGSLPDGRHALCKAGLGREVLTGPLSCVGGRVRERKGNTKQVEQNNEEGEQEGIRGKEREENETDRSTVEREKRKQRRKRPRERDRRTQGGTVRDHEKQRQT